MSLGHPPPVAFLSPASARTVALFADLSEASVHLIPPKQAEWNGFLYNIPLIFSIFPGSNFSPTHASPSIFCAYSCHSVKNPICHDQSPNQTISKSAPMHTKQEQNTKTTSFCVAPFSFLSFFLFDTRVKHRTHTKCAGLSTVRWARNSALTYSSPSSRICRGRWRRWARSRRRYNGMGGSSAMGSGRRPPPLRVADVAVARRRGWGLIAGLVCRAGQRGECGQLRGWEGWGEVFGML